jgi:GNAT superfamily N-acetyltransferase
MMFEFMKDYKDQEMYRNSFNQLAQVVFGINFEDWYQTGCWNERYIPYSLVKDHQVVANASVNKMDLIINHRELKAIQIGTVMTDKNYRNLGLSKQLIEKIIADYESQVDLIYLFANDSVLNFYPKFGFKVLQESKFVFPNQMDKPKTLFHHVRKMDLSKQSDFDLFHHFARKRTPISMRCGVVNLEHLLTFYGLMVYTDAIYYIEALKSIVIYEENANRVELYDVMSLEKVDLEEVLPYLPNKPIKFHFTPDLQGEALLETKLTEHTLFVKPNIILEHFQFPAISHA